MSKKIFSYLILATGLLVSCSKSNDGGGNNTIDCSGGQKTFSGDVSPIIQSSCAINTGCHATGSPNGPGALETYQQVFNNRSAIRNAVMLGTMPKTGVLTSSQKNAIICWIDSGAPNN